MMSQERSDIVETIKEEADQGSKRHNDFMKRYFLQCDKVDKSLPYDILSKSLGLIDSNFQVLFQLFVDLGEEEGNLKRN